MRQRAAEGAARERAAENERARLASVRFADEARQPEEEEEEEEEEGYEGYEDEDEEEEAAPAEEEFEFEVDLDDTDFGPTTVEQMDMVDGMKAKYSVLDEDVIKIALEACNWDVNVVTIVLDEQMQEVEEVSDVIIINLHRPKHTEILKV